ncbi:MAG TPA: UDP-3-O-(3-hydroxymyristoyl)glucosamine N-acyltransferase [Chitinophagaceae bacterium]|nr:UDP-3-O-(3-hydroxymyristoyl)glucosamine N-acyltransferase [Chitinophagaceae bacterium]
MSNQMHFTAQQIATLVNGKIEGDPAASVASFAKIEEAGKGQLAFLGNPKYEQHLYTTGASVIIVNESQSLKQPVEATLIRVPDAYAAFAQLLSHYEQFISSEISGIQQPSYIAGSARLGENVFVGAFTYIGEEAQVGNGSKIFPNSFLGDRVRVGKNTVIHAGVAIYPDCVIGDNVTIHAGVVIGSDGFGFLPQPDGSLKKVPQLGNVVIEDNVEIGANTTIDRATMGSTRIRSGTKIDNLVQVAHNVDIGNFTVIAAQAGISGSVKLGRGVLIGGQAGIAGHIEIGDGAKINAQSGVGKSLQKGKAVTGSPAYDYAAALRSQALSRKLPELERRIRELEEELKRILKQRS